MSKLYSERLPLHVSSREVQWTKDSIRFLKTMIDERLGGTAIAKRLGIGKTTLYRFLRKNNLKLNPKFPRGGGGSQKEIAWKLVLRRPELGECWEETAHRKLKGYPAFKISGKIVYIHRYHYEKYKGPIPKGAFVCHDCDNPSCVNPDHLHLGNNSSNQIEMWRRNETVRKRLKLADRQVDEIRKSPKTAGEIAEKYGISDGYVLNLRKHKNRKQWLNF